MRWIYTLTACVAAWLVGAIAAEAQQIPPPRIFVAKPAGGEPGPRRGEAVIPAGRASGRRRPPAGQPPAVADPPPVEPPRRRPPAGG